MQVISKNDANLDEAQLDSLWKYGISGDNPILIIKIKNILMKIVKNCLCRV